MNETVHFIPVSHSCDHIMINKWYDSMVNNPIHAETLSQKKIIIIMAMNYSNNNNTENNVSRDKPNSICGVLTYCKYNMPVQKYVFFWVQV